MQITLQAPEGATGLTFGATRRALPVVDSRIEADLTPEEIEDARSAGFAEPPAAAEATPVAEATPPAVPDAAPAVPDAAPAVPDAAPAASEEQPAPQGL